MRRCGLKPEGLQLIVFTQRYSHHMCRLRKYYLKESKPISAAISIGAFVQLYIFIRDHFAIFILNVFIYLLAPQRFSLFSPGIFIILTNNTVHLVVVVELHKITHRALIIFFCLGACHKWKYQ